MDAQRDGLVSCPSCGRKNRLPAAASGVPRCGNCRSLLPWIVSTTDAAFTETVEQADLPVLVDLWAEWCGPCRMVSPALEQVAADLAGRVKLVQADVDQCPQLARRFEVQAVPTLVILDRGEVIGRRAGALPAASLRSWVDEVLARHDHAASTSRGSGKEA
ncbi:thioredoxin [Streptomyces smyrnaeus]|uniref:thioredoxin n=1 Tax=Streptomyces smyrnaeus TaxID=1387713 RepID=UPI003410422A